MGNDEAVAPSKPEKALSPVQEQPVVYQYSDWAAMQAYYGSGVPMPHPYFNTAVGHPPHPYMWGTRPLLPPYGTPYPAAVYPHGVYAHPPVSLVASSPSTTDVPSKSANSKDGGLMKKLKGFDGLAVSIGNGNAESVIADGSGQSRSEDNGVEGSTDGTDDSAGKETQRKRSSDDTTTSRNTASRDQKSIMAANAINGGETSPNISVGVAVPPICTMPVTDQTPGMEFKPSTTNQLKAGIHPEHWTQDERELKREKRKQSNRESARRSRLRKQAETEELATKVDDLIAENMTLLTEMNELKENLVKLKAENSSLMEKLKNTEAGDKFESQEEPTVVVENFLSRIDELRQDENRENSNGGKLRQLLDSDSRTDAVAAG